MPRNSVSIDVYDGRTRLGEVIREDGQFDAILDGGERIGRFDSLKAATAALHSIALAARDGA